MTKDLRGRNRAPEAACTRQTFCDARKCYIHARKSLCEHVRQNRFLRFWRFTPLAFLGSVGMTQKIRVQTYQINQHSCAVREEYCFLVGGDLARRTTCHPEAAQESAVEWISEGATKRPRRVVHAELFRGARKCYIHARKSLCEHVRQNRFVAVLEIRSTRLCWLGRDDIERCALSVDRGVFAPNFLHKKQLIFPKK